MKKLPGNKLMKMGGTKMAGDIYIHYCPACNGKHGILVKESSSGNNKHSFNDDAENPTFTPAIKIDFMLDDHSTTVRKGICHYAITDGMIHYLKDSTHDLAGSIIPLPDVDSHVSINMH